VIGFAICGSFCTFDKAFEAMRRLVGEGWELVPIMSQAAATTDTRFGRAADNVKTVTEICGREPVLDIVGAEPFGPKTRLEAVIIAPCTGNTLGRLAAGITDGPVTMTAKAHLRSDGPLVIAISTNDALSANLTSIARLLERKNIYFVPFGQDDPKNKPHSLIADFSLIPETLRAALLGRQIQPLLI
jgi:dipicolinate synthase subunit B